MDGLGDEDEQKPYFIGYEVTQKESVYVSASFGALTATEHSRHRYLDVDLRVGDYGLDNTRPLRGQAAARRRSFSRLPLEDDVDALRSVIWNATDHHYKEAAEQLTKVRMDVEVKVDAEDQSADFSREQPVQDLRPVAALDADVAAWEAKARRYSAPFASHDEVYAARATIHASAETRWLVNSERNPPAYRRDPLPAASWTPRLSPKTAWRCRATNPSPRTAQAGCRTTTRWRQPSSA